jgi:hypothetical protein
MHSPSETALPGFSTLAHGFFHEKRNGRVFIGHGGDTVFFHTELGLLPEERVGIFCSFNSRGREDAVYALRKALIDQFMDRYFPQANAPQRPASLPSAVADAQKIAGRYESSRRIEHGFLSIFYLLQQPVIRANADGTIEAPRGLLPGDARFHEIAPDVWQESDGAHQLALRNVNGVKTVLDSEDPTSVLQAVPARRSAPLNLTILLGAVVILILTVVLWPITYLMRRHYDRALAHSAETRRLRLFLRIAAALDLIWLVCWMTVLTPVLATQLDFYSTSLDGVIRALQIAGLMVIALAAVGIWSFWRFCRVDTSWSFRIGNGAIVAALIGLVWIGFIGGLIGFNLNY